VRTTARGEEEKGKRRGKEGRNQRSANSEARPDEAAAIQVPYKYRSYEQVRVGHRNKGGDIGDVGAPGLAGPSGRAGMAFIPASGD
jgi:hypothetical protein